MKGKGLIVRFSRLFYSHDMPAYMVSERIIVYVRWVLLVAVTVILLKTSAINRNFILITAGTIALYNLGLSVLFYYKPAQPVFRIIQYMSVFIDELLLLAIMTGAVHAADDIYPMIFFAIFSVSLRMNSEDSYAVSALNVVLLPAILFLLTRGDDRVLKAALLGIASIVNLFSTRVIQVNTKLFKQEIQKTAAIFSLSSRINSVMELTPLFEIAIQELVNRINAVAGVIAFFDNKKGAYTHVASSGNLDIIGGSVSMTMLYDKVINKLMRKKKYLILPERNGETAVTGGSWFQSLQSENAVLFPFPCSTTSSTYHAVLCLFGRNDNSRFSSYDINFLKAVSSQITICVNRAFLYEDLLYNRVIQRELLSRIETNYDDERRKIAGEIHDMASGVMYELVNSIDTFIGETKGMPPSSKKKLDHIKSLVINYHKQLRTFMGTLRPTVLEDFGLIHALKDLLGNVRQQYSIDVEFVHDESVYPLTSHQEEFLYRVANEALINVAKHASASSAVVRLSRHNSHIVMSIMDNGSGFNPMERFTNRYGLLYIKERVNSFKGRVDIVSEAGKGATITVMLPLTEVERA